MSHRNPAPGHSPTDPKAGRRKSGRAQKDPIQDPYHAKAKHSGPGECPQCDAVYVQGRWQWGLAPKGADSVLCPACRRIIDRVPAGIVTLTGASVRTHGKEMIRLARHQEETEKKEHALNRIIAIDEEAPDKVVITTTDIHLPRRIGETIERAYHGKLKEDFDEDGYFVRVDWHNDG